MPYNATLERGWGRGGGGGGGASVSSELECASSQQAEQAPSDGNKSLSSGVFHSPVPESVCG